MSSTSSATSAPPDDIKLLRRFADLVSDCREALLPAPGRKGTVDADLQPSGAGATDEEFEAIELRALSTLLHLFALRIIECKNLWHLLGSSGEDPAEHEPVSGLDQLCTGLRALQKSATRFSLYSLPLSKCESEPLDRIWSMIHAEGLDPLWNDSNTLGYAYQYFAKPRRRETQTNIQSANKDVSRRQLIAFTQLYTPRWIVQFLLQNTVLPVISGRVEHRSTSRDWLLPTNNDQCSSSVQAAHLNRFSLIDPASGSGHFLAPAFALLFDLHRATGAALRQSADVALSQIFGADIDRSALAVCAMSILLEYMQHARCLPQARWNGLESVDDKALGSLRRDFDADHVLMQKYSVVVTNPPYIGRKLMSRELKSALKQNYPNSHQDLCAPFMVRGLELLKPGGRLGFITQSSLLSLPSFSHVRNLLSSGARLQCAVELGSGVFPLQSGDKVSSVLVIADASAASNGDSPAMFIDLSNSAKKEDELQKVVAKAALPGKGALLDKKVFLRHLNLFQNSPQQSFQYRCPQYLFELFSRLPQLSSIADVRQGLATTDNSRFLRYWWEVDASEIGTIWFPYVKGAGTERWASPHLHVVNFADNGRAIKEAVASKYPYLKGKTAWVVKNEQYYFRAGLCFSFVSTERFAVRLLPAGCIFDVAASGIFVEESEKMFLLAYLNSRLMRAICRLFNPTINMQVGDVKRLPLMRFTESDRGELARLAQECVEHKQRLNDLLFPGLRDNDRCFLLDLQHDSQPGQSCLRLIDEYTSRLERLRAMEQLIDRLVLERSLDLHELSTRDRDELVEWIDSECPESRDLPAAIDEKTLAELSWLYAVMEGGFCASPATAFARWIEEALKVDLSKANNDRLYLIAKRHFRGKLPAVARHLAPGGAC